MRVKQDTIPGESIPVWFTPTMTGDWEINCSQLCGLGHYRMRGFYSIKSAGRLRRLVEGDRRRRNWERRSNETNEERKTKSHERRAGAEWRRAFFFDDSNQNDRCRSRRRSGATDRERRPVGARAHDGGEAGLAAQEAASELRTLLMLEPRGHAGMHGAMLTEPVSPKAHAGLLSMHAAGFPLVSGEGVIGAVTIALENRADRRCRRRAAHRHAGGLVPCAATGCHRAQARRRMRV